jgi:tRNA (guanosine-2'-O-)-methyltransferase
MKNSKTKQLIDTIPSPTLVDLFEPYVTDKRKARIDEVLSGRLSSIQLAIEAPSDINNALAAIRTSEALGIANVHIICPEGTAGQARRVTQGAIYWVDVTYHETLDEFIQIMHQKNIKLAGGRVTATKSVSEIPLTDPICIMIGNEQRGLSEAAQTACNIEYKIPMFGMSESLNLSVSAAISLFDTSSRKRQALKRNSDLSHEQVQTLKAAYYINSIAPRLVDSLTRIIE